MYTGKNRNMSIISKNAVEKALPSLAGIPIVGEFSVESKDFKGHGGKIDLDSYDFVHTTKPYGFVPESATYEWEEVKTRDGSREYLTIDGCYLWTGRYEEAYSVIENGKGQSMEIEVTDGFWNEDEEAYQIDNFLFSALCILGDEVQPAFEDASITAYSLDKDSFKQEFNQMLNELKSIQEKEENSMLKALLEKYSLTVEELTAKGIDFNAISEDELEAKIVEVFEIEVEAETAEGEEATEVVEPEVVEGEGEGEQPEQVEQPEAVEEVTEVEEVEAPEAVEETPAVDVEALEARVQELEGELEAKDVELNELREFKLEVEKADHESKVQKLFSDFQLTQEDVEGLDIHKFSVEEIEEKCYAIIGKKMAKKNFSAQSNSNQSSIKLPVGNESTKDKSSSRYGDLFKNITK